MLQKNFKNRAFFYEKNFLRLKFMLKNKIWLLSTAAPLEFTGAVRKERIKNTLKPLHFRGFFQKLKYYFLNFLTRFAFFSRVIFFENFEQFLRSQKTGTFFVLSYNNHLISSTTLRDFNLVEREIKNGSLLQFFNNRLNFFFYLFFWKNFFLSSIYMHIFTLSNYARKR